MKSVIEYIRSRSRRCK